MESAIAILVAVGMAVGMALVLGFFIQKWGGAAVLALLALVGAAITMACAWLGYSLLLSRTTGWIGLIIGLLVAGGILAFAFSKITEVARSSRFAAGLWFGYSALCIFGYLAGGVMGLFTITLPGVLLFWLGLYHLSSDLLPLRNKTNKTERNQAFRSLITFTLGTNYPFYSVDEYSQPIKRVNGNAFLKFFAGPGLVITDANHAVYVTDGVFVKGIFEPGLTFTGKYDLEPRIIDLRPQLRAFPVDALTKDGIPISVVTFIPTRIDPVNQAVELGRSFPFSKEAVSQAMSGEVVERKSDKKDQASGQKYKWDGGPQDGLVPRLITPLVQDVIGHYTIDALCAPFEPDKDPRVEIAATIRTQAKEELRPYGLEMIGGGISNLLPKDKAVIKRRIDTWRTRWIGEILIQMGESQAYRKNQLELARAKSEAEMIKRFGQIVRSSVRSDLHRTLMLGLIDSIRNVVGHRENEQSAPSKEIEETLKRLRGEN
jgi:hypothetical protein